MFGIYIEFLKKCTGFKILKNASLASRTVN